MVSIIKKHLTTDAVIIESDAGVYAQQVNYGTSVSTPDGRSVTDTIVRHFEDYNAKFVVDKINTGFICSDAGGLVVDVSQGQANVKGIWVTSDGVLQVTVTGGADTYYIILQKGDDALGQEARIPLNDTIALTYVADGSFDETTDFAIAKVVTDGADITSFEDFGAFYTLRADYIKPKKGNTIKIFTGTFPEAVTLNTFFSGTKLINKVDGGENLGGLYTGFDHDVHIYHLSGTGNYINNQNSQDMWVALDGVSKFGFRSTGFEVVDNFTVSGTSNMIGAVSMSGALLVDDNVTILGTLAVSGAMTFDDAVDVLGNFSVSGTTILDETLNVLGATTLQSTLNVSGAMLVDNSVNILGTLAVSGAMTFDNNADVLGNFSVSGTTILDETLNVLGAVTNQSTMNTIGASSFSGAMLLDDTLEVIGASSFSGAMLVDDTFQALGIGRFESDFYVDGNATFSGTLTVPTIAGTVGLGFLSRHSTGGLITYRTFAQVLSDIGAQATAVFAVPETVGTTNTEGVASTFSRGDHVHAREHAIYSHPASHSDGEISDDIGAGGATKAQLEALLMFGASNSAYVPCIRTLELPVGLMEYDAIDGGDSNVDGTDGDLIFELPLPTVKGSLKLYVKDVILTLWSADTNNKVVDLTLYGSHETSLANKIADSTDRTAQGTYTYTNATADDMSTYDRVFVKVDILVAGANLLAIRGIKVECYYA